MNDAAVAPGLMLRDGALLLEDNDREAGMHAGELERDSETDDSGADDGNIAMGIVHGWQRRAAKENPMREARDFMGEHTPEASGASPAREDESPKIAVK